MALTMSRWGICPRCYWSVTCRRRGRSAGLRSAAAASPRATIFLTRAAKALAFLDSRGYVTPQDIKTIGYDVLRHRVSITYEAEAEEKTSETIIQKIFDELPVP